MDHPDKVLIVDDEKSVLNGLRRQLGKRFQISTATNGRDALTFIRREGPFGVVVSDMRMPRMDGVELLQQIADIAPLTVRMMLTGNAEQESTVRAINLGHVYCFFNKPCNVDELAAGLEQGLREHERLKAEKALIESTLAGSVKLFSDILLLSSPEESRRRVRTRKWAKLVAKEINLARSWELDLAVMLCHIGTVTLPAGVRKKIYAGKGLSQEDQALITGAPEVGAQLLGNIPRLHSVARGILYQQKNFDGSGPPDAGNIKGKDIPIISRILRILNDVVTEAIENEPKATVFSKLASQRGRYDPDLLLASEQAILGKSVGSNSDNLDGAEIIDFVSAQSLRSGVTLVSDVNTADGQLVLLGGVALSETMVQRLRGLVKSNKVKEPFHVSWKAKPRFNHLKN